jgi:hypothetical protein
LGNWGKIDELRFVIIVTNLYGILVELKFNSPRKRLEENKQYKTKKGQIESNIQQEKATVFHLVVPY